MTIIINKESLLKILVRKNEVVMLNGVKRESGLSIINSFVLKTPLVTRKLLHFFSFSFLFLLALSRQLLITIFH